ncbi:HNH endonuclease [Oxalobacteraceae bacterium OM1]|nr:HNH endonuclease [Oxalobacteraceae bacterium OM1]
MERCLLCGRVLVDGPSVNLHHLIPKSHKGTDTVRLHRICHAKIHAVFSEKELADWYHTAERLLDHDEIRKFVSWVRKKDPEFFAKHAPAPRR